MKKKRLLAVFAAFAVAATMAVGFSACEDKDDTAGDDIQKEQPDDSDTANPDQTDNNNVVGKMTEEQWKKAIADTIAATSYTVMATEDMKRQFKSEYDENTGEPIFQDIEDKNDIICKYDGVNGVAYYYLVYTSLWSGKLEKSYVSEDYLEFFGLDIIDYSKSDIDGAWSKHTRSFSTKDEVDGSLMELGIISSLFGAKYKVPETDDAKTIDKIFDQFNYDENTNTYSADLIMVVDNSESPEMRLTVEFANGKLYSYKMEYTIVENMMSSSVKFVYSDYNYTTVTIPEEVKSAVN